MSRRALAVLALACLAAAPAFATPDHVLLDELEAELRERAATANLAPVTRVRAELRSFSDATTAARRDRLIEAAKALERLQQAVGDGRLDAIAPESRALCESLNSERGEHPALDPAAVAAAYTLAAKQGAKRLAGGPAGLGALAARARALEQKLKDPKADANAVARELAQIIDGIKGRGDIEKVLGSSDYRAILGTVDRGFESLRARKVGKSELAALNAHRSSLDESLSVVMRRGIAVPKPGSSPSPLEPKPAVSWLDPVAISFHAALTELLPETSGAIWERFNANAGAPLDKAEVARYTEAIESARPGFEASFGKAPATDKEFLFAGGFYDGTYATRLGESKAEGEWASTMLVTWGEGTPDRLAEQARKYAKPGFLPEYVADSPERWTLCLIRGECMQKTAKPKQTIVPKHFPGGSPDLEMTENRIVTIRGGFKELAPYLAPFLSLIHQRPEALMVNHAVYPDWELQQLKPRWPDLPTGCHGCAMPASLSPYIIRGFLRDGLQFKGLVIADWTDMGGIRSALSALKPRMEPGLRELDPLVVTVILGAYAGLNWIPAQITERTWSASGGPEQFAQYYAKNQEFRKLFDALIDETALLRGESAPEGAKSWREAPLEAKLRLLTRMHKVDDSKAEWTDVWSRGGVMTFSFRVSMLNHLSATSFPNLAAFRKDNPGPKAEDAWIAALQADPKFREAYEKIDWDGPEMREAFFEYFQSLQQAP